MRVDHLFVVRYGCIDLPPSPSPDYFKLVEQDFSVIKGTHLSPCYILCLVNSDKTRLGLPRMILKQGKNGLVFIYVIPNLLFVFL
jgi:hypothetical protein